MNIVGLSAFGAGAGAGLVRAGRALVAVEEERFSRKLGDPSLPRRAVRACLDQTGLARTEIDAWVFYEKPLRRFERVLFAQLAAFPRSSASFARELFVWLGQRMWLKTQLGSELGIDSARVFFSANHVAHAAGAFFLSPFDEAAVLVVDGAGEWATTSMLRASGTKLEVLAELHHPHSLALAGDAVARYLGFPGPGGAERVAALAAHGDAHRADEVRRFVRVDADGALVLDARAFASDLGDGLVCGPSWNECFGPPRLPSDPLLAAGDVRAHADVAASFQAVLEDALLAHVRALHRRVPSHRLCLAGRVAQNARALARIAAEGPFAELFVPPHCGAAGAALGAALHAHSILVPGRRPEALDDARLGEGVVRDQRADGACAAPVSPNAAAPLERMLAVLTAGATVGWVRGRAEFGPSPLGQRCLLADPRRTAMAAHVARAILKREEFMPLAVVVPAERVGTFFESAPGGTRRMRQRQVLLRATSAGELAAPAVLDPSGCARVQCVHADLDPDLHRLLTRFGALSGAPLLLVAELAPRGEPPVRSEREAVSFYERSALDMLVVEERVYARS